MRWNERGSCSKVAFFPQVKAGFLSHKYAAARHKWLIAWKQLCTAEELEHKSKKFGLELPWVGAFSLAAGSSNAAFCLGWGCWGLLPLQLNAELPKGAGVGLCLWLSHYHSLSLSTALFKTRVSLEYCFRNWGRACSVSLWVQPPINGEGVFCAPLVHTSTPLLTLLCSLGVYCNVFCSPLKGKRKQSQHHPLFLAAP